MAKPREVIAAALTDMNKKLREIKQADDDDLGSVSRAFDEIAQVADQAATRLHKADQALSDEGGEQDGEQDEQPEGEEEQEEGAGNSESESESEDQDQSEENGESEDDDEEEEQPPKRRRRRQ